MKEPLFTKNFTLLILGQISSLFGNFILKFALSMYVLEVIGSAAIFAGILAFATIPTIILSPFGGILADRVNRRNIMVVLDIMSGVCVLCVALLFNEQNAIIMIGILLVILSALGAFETPTVQACIPQMHKGDNIIKGNALVNQVAAIASLLSPIFGSMLYVAFGLTSVMYIVLFCFFLTATFEYFIQLEYKKEEKIEKITTIVKMDFLDSMRFICQQEPTIIKMLSLSTLISFFVVGVVLVGFPFMIRNILEMNVKMYGIAESIIGFSAIVGGIVAATFTKKLKISKLFWMIAFIGICFILSGVVFFLSVGVGIKYIITIISFCSFQAMVCIFSIFVLSYIQQKTPNSLMGKVMSYISTISVCSQPFSQTVYGILFDKFHSEVYFVLIPTGFMIVILGLLSKRFFEKINNEKVLT